MGHAGRTGEAATVLPQRIRGTGDRGPANTSRSLPDILGIGRGRAGRARFAVLVGIATVIALPLGDLGMREWLDGFAYHAGIAWWIFVLAAAAALLIAVTTVSYHSIRAAMMNPVRSLRYE